MKNFKTIAWDIDDVLNSLTLEWLLYFKKQFDIDINYPDINKNPPHLILGITKDEYLNSLDFFREKFFMKLKPKPELITWFEKNGDKFRHIALTATPFGTSPLSAYWVIKNFGKWIRSFNYVPSYRKKDNIPIYDNNKKDFLNYYKQVDLFIDDSEKNVDDAIQLGVNAILFPAPWNKSRNCSLDNFIKKLDALLEE